MLGLTSYIAFAQAKLTLKVDVITQQGKPLADIRMWMQDKTTGQVITQRTDYNGKTTFVVPEGIWSLNLVGLLNYQEFPVHDRSEGTGSILITYDLNAIQAEQDFIKNRNRTNFAEVDVTGEIVTQPKEGYCVIKIKLENPAGQSLRDVPVRLVSNKQGTIYTNKTNKLSQALFLVPIHDMYAVDINEMKNYSFTGNINRESILTLTLQYEPTNVKETVSNDIIHQELPEDIKATSARSSFTITVLDAGGDPFVNESVYLHEIHGNKKYVAQTDEEGTAEFLLPNGAKYMIHFEYEKDVDVLNLTTVWGRNTVQIQVTYRPDPRLQYPEQYIPKPEELFLEEFQSFIDKQLPDPGEKQVGLYLKWGNDKVNAGTKEAILEVDIAVTNDLKVKDKAPPANLAFVIDKSGSMAGYDRIEALKESMVKFVDELRATDNVGLITFNSDAFFEIPVQNVGDGARMKQIINEVELGGGTNIYNAMVMGYEKLLAIYDENKTNQLILLTDGYGETEPQIVVDKSKEYNAKGIGISAVGVGDYYNSALLKLLTIQSGGLMQHCGKSEDIYSAFKNQLSGIVFPLGRDAKLEIKYNEQIELDNFYGMPVKEQKDNTVVINLGDMYAGVNKVSLAQFALNLPDESIEEQPVSVTLTYFDIATQQERTITEQAVFDWNTATGKLDLIVDNYQKKLYAIAVLNQSMKVMIDAFAEKDLDKAINTYERSIAQIKDLFPEARDEDVKRLTHQMMAYAEAIYNYQKKEGK